MEDNSFNRLPSQMLFGELKEGVCQQGSLMKNLQGNTEA